jgi:hypothetical protein
MENNKNVMMGLIAVGLCLGLLWGVSPSMAGSTFEAENQYKTKKPRSFKTPAMQQRNVQSNTRSNMAAPKSNKSLIINPSNTKNSKVTTKNPLILNPGYDQKRISENMTKGYRSDVGPGQAKINIGKPVKLNPKLSPSAEMQQNVQTAGPQQKAPSAEALQNVQSNIGLTSPPIGHSGVDYQKKLKQAAEAAAAKKEAQLHAQPQAELQPTKGPDPDALTKYGGSVVPPGGIGGYSLSKPIGQTPSAQPAGTQQKAPSAEAQQNVQTAGTQQKAPSAEAQQKQSDIGRMWPDAYPNFGGVAGSSGQPKPMGPDPDAFTNFGGSVQQKAPAQAGSGGWGGGYGKAPSDPNFGGYGGSGVMPPGPDRVPGSTPPPSAQSKKSGPNVADKAIGVLDVCKSKPWDAVGCFQKGISVLGDSLNPF